MCTKEILKQHHFHFTQTKHGKKSMEKFREKAELEVIRHKRTGKMANLVELMMRQERLLKQYGEEGEEGGQDLSHIGGVGDSSKGARKQENRHNNDMSKTCVIL